MLLLRRLDRARDDWIRKRICSFSHHETWEADNFQTLSGKYRGEAFVTALLECHRKSGDGTLSVFIAEIRAEVMSYRHPEDPAKVPPPPQSAVSITVFWKKKAFIPIQRESSLAETISLAMDDIKCFKLAELYNSIRPAQPRDHVAEEIGGRH